MSIAEKHFTEDVRQFMLARIEHTVLREVSPEYAEIYKQYEEQFQKLASMQSEKGKALLEKLDELINHLEVITQGVVYNSGFSDGVRFILQTLAGGGV